MNLILVLIFLGLNYERREEKREGTAIENHKEEQHEKELITIKGINLTTKGIP